MRRHKELAHLSDIEYRRALNRINANNSYRRKSLIKTQERLNRLQTQLGLLPTPPAQTSPQILPQNSTPIQQS